jgi:hypothetical protein
MARSPMGTSRSFANLPSRIITTPRERSRSVTVSPASSIRRMPVL